MPSKSSQSGAIVEAEAIAFYTKRGWVVSIPFSPTTYDLVAEDRDGEFHRVQCKYSSRLRYGTKINLPRAAGLQEFDLLFCMNMLGHVFEVPVSAILNRKSLFLTDSQRVFIPDATSSAVQCGRCYKPNATGRSVCAKCAGETRAAQRVYRSKKQLVVATDL